MLEVIAEIFSRCFKDGVFPRRWKRARLVLIPKGERRQADGEDLPKARPICLLDEIGKILKRILVVRIKDFMKRKPKARLSDCQFGFREGRSTIDVLETALHTITRLMSRGGGGIRYRCESGH